MADWEGLRKPFPRELIGKVPASAKRPALDFVGHAVVTDRLNQCAPGWSFTIDERFMHGDDCWVQATVTIDGVSRSEYGDGPDPKQAVSNALRRAAMRFGVALDLWSKEDLPPSPAGETKRVSKSSGTQDPAAGATPALSVVPAGDLEVSSEGEGLGEVPEPSGEAKALFAQFVSLCKEADLKPLSTFVQVTSSPASWRQLQAGEVPVADVEKAIAHVAEVLLRAAP